MKTVQGGQFTFGSTLIEEKRRVGFEPAPPKVELMYAATAPSEVGVVRLGTFAGAGTDLSGGDMSVGLT
jgi:hypothetical protein